MIVISKLARRRAVVVGRPKLPDAYGRVGVRSWVGRCGLGLVRTPIMATFVMGVVIVIDVMDDCA